jgi:hypothetical protein
MLLKAEALQWNMSREWFWQMRIGQSGEIDLLFRADLMR